MGHTTTGANLVQAAIGCGANGLWGLFAGDFPTLVRDPGDLAFVRCFSGAARLLLSVIPVAASTAAGTGLCFAELRVRPSAPRAGPALALVHRLDASDRYRTALFDQIGGQRLRIGKAIGPRVAASE